MARKQSLDEHFLDNAPTAAELEAARNRGMEREQALQAALDFVKANRDRITVTAESEDGEAASDIDQLIIALDDAEAGTLRKFLQDPQGVTLMRGMDYLRVTLATEVGTSELTFQLCEGRHPIPGNPPAIFGNTVNPMDFTGLAEAANAAIPDGTDAVTVFVTGLTPAMLAVVSVCAERGIALTAMNFNRETGEFEPQTVLHA